MCHQVHLRSLPRVEGGINTISFAALNCDRSQSVVFTVGRENGRKMKGGVLVVNGNHFVYIAGMIRCVCTCACGPANRIDLGTHHAREERTNTENILVTQLLLEQSCSS